MDVGMQFNAFPAACRSRLEIPCQKVNGHFDGGQKGIQGIGLVSLLQALKRLVKALLADIKHGKKSIDPRERRLFFPHLKKFSLSFGELPFDHVQAVGASQTQFGSHAGEPGSSLKRVGNELLEVSGRTHAVRGERQVRYRQSFIGAEITAILQRRLLKNRYRIFEAFAGSLVDEVPALSNQIFGPRRFKPVSKLGSV